MQINYFRLLSSIIESAGLTADFDLDRYSDQEINRLLNLASSNRVIFSLCRKIRLYGYLGLSAGMMRRVDQIIGKGEMINRQYAAALKEIKEKFVKNNIPFLIVKTDRKIDYVLSDADILVAEKDFKRANELLAQSALAQETDDKKMRWVYKFPGRAHLDIHRMGTDWYSSAFLDPDSIWEDTEERQFLGEVYQFPSAQNDWILQVLNIIFERFSLIYLDWLYFEKSSDINRAQIDRVAKTHQWYPTLQVLDRHLVKIRKEISGGLAGNNPPLPMMFSFSDVTGIFLTSLFSRRKNQHLSGYFFLYFIYCKARFVLSAESSIPFYGQGLI